MIADGPHPLPDIDLNPSTDLTDLGSVHLDGQLDWALDHAVDHAVDIDGDGLGEMTSIDTEDGLVVLGDHDHDGLAERLTVVDHAGQFASWEFCTAEDGSTRWERTNRGTVGGI